MTITAKIIADSLSVCGRRLTTMQLRYPKFIHGEFMTHRVFSRNASSSRAIPVERLIKDVLEDPAMPAYWGSNKPGMQAGEVCHNLVSMTGYNWDNVSGDITAPAAWLKARDRCVDVARAMHEAGYHKQIINRLIEPWCHINVVVTATEWSNFYDLRRHPDAQPEMQELANAMYEAQESNNPKILDRHEWHLPYVKTNGDGPDDYAELLEIAWAKHKAGEFEQDDLDSVINDYMIKISVARCARVSYLTHEGKVPDISADLALYDRLVGSVPLHASPAEHQAVQDTFKYSGSSAMWEHQRHHGNFVGWRQYRKMLDAQA